jgi:chaperonin cofactor prefoldin
MQYTGSISRGETAEKHNTRECYRDDVHTPDNIDRSRTPENITLVNRSLDEVYRERFGEALEAYNAKQVEKGHAERQIPDYLEKVRGDKKLKPMYEFVVQVGNVDERPDAETACAIYREWLDRFMEKYGVQFAVKQAIVHMDEAVPHMHVEFVPCATSTRGLGVQNSMNKAVKQAGFSDYKAMLAGWDEVLTEVMEKHGIERVAGDREKQMGGVDIDTYKKSMAVRQETEQAEERLECLRQRADAEAAAVADLGRAITEAEAAQLEPAGETVRESAGALFKARGDGEREEGLASEIEGLRSRISELEGANQRARERVAELDRGLPGLRGRYSQLEQRFGAIELRVKQVIQRLREVPETVSAWALDIANRLGKRTYNPNSLDYVMRQATRAAEAFNRSRDWEPRQNRGRAR